MVSSLTSPSPVSVSARLSPWSSRAPLSNGNALNSDRCSKLEMKKEIALASSSLKRILQGLDRQCISLGSVQERRLNPMHVLCSSSSTSSSPPVPVSSREDETSSSFVLLNVSLFCVFFETLVLWEPSWCTMEKGILVFAFLRNLSCNFVTLSGNWLSENMIHKLGNKRLP